MDWVVFEDETIISFCIIFCIDKAHHDVLTVGTCSAVEMMLGQHICLFPFTRIHFSYITLAPSAERRETTKETQGHETVTPRDRYAAVEAIALLS